MNYKIFKMPFGSRVMVMETEEFVEYYLQINSSDWHFCVGCKENFDEITEEDAKTIWNDYYEYCDESEQVLEKHANDELECWDKFKKVVRYDYDSFNDEPTTMYEFNIDDETNVGHLPIPEETKEWFNDKTFVNYFLRKISKGHCNGKKKKALNVLGIKKYPHPWRNSDLRIEVQFN